MPVRLARLLHQSCQLDWRDSKGPDLKKMFCPIHFSNNDYKKAKIEKKIGRIRLWVEDWGSLVQRRGGTEKSVGFFLDQVQGWSFL
jgi:hypothetical protein